MSENAPQSRFWLWPSAEQELILTAAVGPETAARQAFEQWSETADFHQNFDLGTFRLLPLVYRRMHALGVSAPTMPKLKGIYRYAWCDTQALYRSVAPAITLLQANNIELLLLKGAPLLAGYYKGFGLRPMNDVDVVVRREDLRKSTLLLEEAGWKQLFPNLLSDRHYDYHQSMEFRNSEGRDIDLHGHFLVDACNEHADRWFWSSSVPFEFMGTETRQLDATALLLHVVVHGMRPNRDPPIRWIADAMTILSNAERDIRWPDIVAFARAQCLTYRLHLGFSYLVDRFSAPIPSFVLSQLRAARLSWTEWAEHKFLFDVERRPSTVGRICLVLGAQARRSQGKTPLRFLSGIFTYAQLRLWLGLKVFWSRITA